jgi:hypothetical protein
LGLGTNFALAQTTTTLSNLISSNNVFYKVGSAQVEAQTVNETSYPVVTLTSSTQSVAYRKNLAYSWFKKATDDENDDKGTAGMLSLTIGLLAEDNALPATYAVTFQSQQYEKTKDGVTTNHLVFVPDSATQTTGVYAYVTQDSDDLTKTIDEIREAGIDTSALITDYANIEISFTDYSEGNYSLNILSDDNQTPLKLTNIGGTYAKYSNSSTSVTPLALRAAFGDQTSGTAKIVVKELNGQSFALNDSEAVTDNVAPVLCLDDDVRFVEFGSSISASYTAIDVLSSSLDVKLSYYVYSKEASENVYTTLSNNSAAVLLTHANSYRFTSADTIAQSATVKGVDGTEVYAEDGETISYYKQYALNDCAVDALVKVKYTIADGTSDDNNSTEVLLDWYVPEMWKVSPKGSTTSYMIASTDEQGATFDNSAAVPDENKTYFNEAARDAYQQKIDELIEKQSLSAGSSNYLYLPSIESLVSDLTTSYQDLKISIYYINGSGSKSSNTSLSPSNLSINVTTAGDYEFTFYVTDSEGNPMYYINKGGEREEFTSSDIWDFHDDSENRHILPWFSFRVGYTQPTVEDPGVCTLGYVNSTYSSISFDINGISGTYKTAYYLYYFDRNAYTKDTDISLTYEEFVEQVETLKEDPAMSKYFTRILTSDEVANYAETDQEYIDNIDYAWDDSSLSFVPQDDNAFYVVKLDLTYNNVKKSTYMAIAVSAEAESFYGEVNWAANNIASIVLLCVAGVAFIAIIVLLVVKPKDSGDIDVIDQNQQAAKAKKAKGKKKNIDLDNE